MFPTSTVGKKILMAVTGQMMLLFIIGHVLGNSTIYFSDLNAYAAALHGTPILFWVVRPVMVTVLCFHVYLGITMTLENRNAKPDAYAVANYLSATFASRNMIWTGAMIGAFLVFHLLHFTIQVIYPQYSALRHPDALGRPDVYGMVVQNFQHIGVAFFYILSLAGLLLHLLHGIQSSIQTWGLNNDLSFPLVTRGGKIASAILFVGYVSIPLVIIAGILKY